MKIRLSLLCLFVITQIVSFAQGKKITLAPSSSTPSANKVSLATKVGSGVTIIKVSNSTGTPGTNQFVVATGGSRTSAAAYRVSDGVMVRTLWSGIFLNPGTYTIKWDGTDDMSNSLPVVAYTIKVLTNNVNYTWQGTLANTSTSQTDKNAIHRSLDPVSNLLIIGTNAYYAVGYDEATPSMFEFALSNPQTKLNPFDGYGNQTTDFACTDGTNIYWTAWDNYDTPNNYDGGVSKPAPTSLEQSFVFATKISDNTLVSFSSGLSKFITYGKTYSSVIDYKANHAKASGIAVSGSYLFVSYKALGIIDVLNKSTGALVQTLTMTTPTCMVVDGSSIWITTGTNTLQKYPINGDGTVGTASTSISGLSSPADIKINGTTLVVVDGGTSNQVKTFNTSTGVAGWVLGDAGGNLNTPVVTNTRFAFWYMNEGTAVKQNRGSIAFVSDGSFWVTDASNRRMLHFDVNRNYLEQIQYQGKTYTCYVDPNNHTRMMANFLEFAVNYDQSDIHNSWSYKYNWEGKVIAGTVVNDAVQFITTFSNGRTYGLVHDNAGTEVVELDPTTGLRYTGIVFNADVKMKPNGDLYVVNGTAIGENQQWLKYQLTGFSGINPTYSGSSIAVTNPVASSAYDPRLSGAKIRPWELTSTGALVCFRGNIDKDGLGNSIEAEGSYHLGVMDISNPSSPKWLWKTCLVTPITYGGEFPFDGAFDQGNGPSQYAGNVAVAMERNIIWGFNGEFWKGSQTNKWNHYYDDGLFVGQFGKTGPEYNVDNVLNGAFAGNAFSPALVKEGTDYYMYHNDESVHGGILRWKITGLNTIQEQTISIPTTFTRTVEAKTLQADNSSQTITDLMTGIPFYTSSLSNNTGLTSYSPTGNGNFTISAGVISYRKRYDRDVTIQYGGGAGVASFNFNLGTNTSGAWTISGNYRREGITVGNGADFAQLQVLDGAGKIIAKLDYMTPSYGSSGFHIQANGQDMMADFVTNGVTTQNFVYNQQPLTITATSSTSVTFNYGSLTKTVPIADATANWQNPKTLRMYCTGGGQRIFMQNFTFIK